MDSFTVMSPLDMHTHLRSGDMLELVLPFTAKHCAAALVMPNTEPPITDAASMLNYYKQIKSKLGRSDFRPLMTFKLHDYMEPDEIPPLVANGAIAGKLYPTGATTNSSNGVSNLYKMERVFAEMERLDVVLCLHAEDPEADALSREDAFLLKWLDYLYGSYPKLRVVIEHISSKASLYHLMQSPPTVAATVTLHHLMITLEDIIGGPLAPHNFCRPIAKSKDDRDALLDAVMSGDSRLMLGSDSAPHAVKKKESSGCAAGVFTAPVLIPALFQLFEEKHDHYNPFVDFVDDFNNFVFNNAKKFYKLSDSQLPGAGTLEIVRESWTVPEEYSLYYNDEASLDVKPFLAGKTLQWKVKEDVL